MAAVTIVGGAYFVLMLAIIKLLVDIGIHILIVLLTILVRLPVGFEGLIGDNDVGDLPSSRASLPSDPGFVLLGVIWAVVTTTSAGRVNLIVSLVHY